MDFTNKVVLVTGSSRGLGANLVYNFARNGADVIINYNDSYDDAILLKERIKSDFSKDAFLVKCDVSNEESVKNMISSIISKFGRIDILVNNAGICYDSEFDKKDISNFRRIFDVNVIGTYLVSKYVCFNMLDNKCGKVINISSDNAFNGYPESADYDVSKAGVISLTHNMAKFYAPYINVNCICPGWIDTDMNKNMDLEVKNDFSNKVLLKRFASCDEISNVVMFLASDMASYVNDSVINVNGGMSDDK